MEFNYRANPESPPHYQHSASDPSVFRDQPYLSRRENRRVLMLPNPNVRYMTEREIEKERIRREIMAEEIMRRRELEDEVRRELTLERKLTFCNTVEECRLPPAFSLIKEPTMHNLFSSAYKSDAQFLLNKPPSRKEELIRRERTLHNHFVSAHNSVVQCSLNKLRTREEGLSGKETTLYNDFVSTHNSAAQFSLNKPQTREGELSGSSRARSPISSVDKRRYETSFCCALCELKMENQHDLQKHLQGKKHSKKVIKTQGGGDSKNKKQKVEKANEETRLWCETCDVHASSVKQMDEHLRGKKHLSKESMARKKDGVRGEKHMARENMAIKEDDGVEDEDSVSLVVYNARKKYAAEDDVESK